MVKRIYQLATKDNYILKGHLRTYEDLFTGLGCIPGQHHIQIDTTGPPVVHAPRKVPVSLKDKIVEELHRMERM